ncbi:Snf2 family helicase atpase [Mycena venus]|uniref:Snf2 family helicase atpase n=1 Tax=Mycena venus TaxID=2733690 RepID=A0A8H6TZ08_9AGAR|nr:Snf2 family helicase atpase [Mycena venus]
MYQALPPKKSYIQYARLSARQREVYEAVLAGGRSAERNTVMQLAARDVLAPLPLCATRRRQTVAWPRTADARGSRRARGGDTAAQPVAGGAVYAWAQDPEVPFSQFTTMLYIIEDWAVEMKGWLIRRIGGSTPPRPDERLPELRSFSLSAGSSDLGVNGHGHLQCSGLDPPGAALRAPGWTDEAKPVLNSRLIGAHTIAEAIMHKATEKRQLSRKVGLYLLPSQSS